MAIQLAAIFRDEAPYLKEWLIFHLQQGIDEILLYNHRSTDQWREVVSSFIRQGRVSVFTVPENTNNLSPQMWAYSHAMANSSHDWLGLWDVDEFVFPTWGSFTLEQVLEKLDRPDLAMLNVCWVLYQSDFETRPDGLVTENYTRRTTSFPKSPSFKSICHPGRCQQIVLNPHWARPKLGYHAFDELGRRLPDTVCYPDESISKIRLNHYFTKSRAEWVRKVERGRADLPGHSRQLEEYDRFNALPTIEDRSIFRFIPALKQAYAAG